MLTQNLNVRADKKSVVPVVHMVQGDSGRRLTCIVQDYDIPSGSSASLSVERPDGNVYIASATISNNNVSAMITSTMIEVVGIVKGTMRITSSGSVVSTFEFVIKVEEAAGSGIEPSPADGNVYVYINGEKVKVVTDPDLEAVKSELSESITDITKDNSIQHWQINAELNKKYEPYQLSIIEGKYSYKGSDNNFRTNTDPLFSCTEPLSVAHNSGNLIIPFVEGLYSNARSICTYSYTAGMSFIRESDIVDGYKYARFNSDKTEVIISIDAVVSRFGNLTDIAFNFGSGQDFYVKYDDDSTPEQKELKWLKITDDNFGNISPSKIYDKIPDYWEETIANKVNEIKSICRENNCIPAVFVTDCHYVTSANVHGQLIKKMDDDIDFSIILNGGDYASQTTNTVESHTEEMENAVAVFKPVIHKMIGTVGNHESIHAGMEDIYPLDMTNYIVQHHISNIPDVHCGYEGNAYYYKDDASRKVRYIILNAHQQYITHYRQSDGTLKEYVIGIGYSKEQLKWLAEKALVFDEDGWSVLFVSHVYTKDVEHVNGSSAETKTGNVDLLFSIINAAVDKTSGGAITGNADGERVDYNFTNGKDINVIGYYCGHYHWDSPPFKNGHVTVIPTASANLVCQDPNARKERGTTTETAFDVLCIDTKKRHVDLVRVGFGNSRQYDY